MKVLVLYESFFGNTEKVAQVVAAQLGSTGDVAVLKVTDASLEQLKGIDLLVVGSPTRGFSAGPGTTAFLKGIPKGSLAGMKAAAFDTRLALEDIKPAFVRLMQKWAGYADVKIAAMLKTAGAEVILPTMGFNVVESEGPLKDGELERAIAWAKQISNGLHV